MRLKFYILSDLLIKKDCNIINKIFKINYKKNIVNFYFLIHKIFFK